MVRGLIGWGGGGGDKSQQQNFCPPLKKTKGMLNLFFFFRSGHFLSIAGIKQALLDDVPSSSDESSGTTDSDDEPSNVEDLNYKKERQGQ